ncbi:MAG TPA: adenylate/guanylate cyclase domain-containing protein, partial [Tianweitania sediminis]|nr:adenylate/guanylate cyclase domain-containing protein [Tianweitania sediminis]
AFDYLSTIDPPRPTAASPIIVAIDEPSLAEIGLQWPWPRDLHGQLVSQLRAAGAKAVGLDIIFAEPSNIRSDAVLAANVGPDVVLAGDETFVEDPHGTQHVRVEPLAQFTEAGARTGIASISPDGDGILRRLPGYEDGFARALLEAAGTAVPPAQGRMMQVLGPARTFATVSYYQALDPDAFLPPNFFRDRVVMVGFSLQNAPTLDQKGSDAYPTSATLRTGRLVPGVEIQATIYDNLAQGHAIARAPAWLLFATGICGALLAAGLVWRGTGWRTLLGVTGGMVVIGLGAFLAMRFGRIFVPPLAPALALTVVAGSQSLLDYASERQLRKGITRAFSQYLSPALVDRLASNPDLLKLGGELRTITVLFCDIRGFTTIAEAMKDDPERLTRLINRLLTPLSNVVMAHGGTIDKYIGDCLMAFWNAPLDDPNHALHAVKASREMVQAVAELNLVLAREAQERGEAAAVLNVGIGINTGACVVGNMGSEQRFDYSALGDAVNLASRLEGSSKELGVPVVIGEATALAAAEQIELAPLRPILVKGRTAATMVYTLAEMRPAADPALVA